MRNTKIALAVLALVASTAAMADGATVYGTLDLSIAKQTNQVMQMNQSTWSTSVFGVKGSEDLDGGMKATYNLEAGIQATDGNISNGGTLGLFNRAANIGLAGEFGSLKLGTQISPFILSGLNAFATDNESFFVPALLSASAVSAAGYLDTANGGNNPVTPANIASTGGFFVPNAVSYTTPSIGGFTASALTQVSGNDGKNSPTTKSSYEKYTTVAGHYAAGDVTVTAAYESNGTLGSALTSTGLATTSYNLAASYNMGPVKLAAGYFSTKFDLAGQKDLNSYTVGAGYNVQENLNVSLNYLRSSNSFANAIYGKASGTTVNTDKQDIINLSGKYSLSKRTFAYATVSRATNGALALYGTGNTAANGDTTGYAVGVSHSF